jgi:four helix bundle protein
MDLVVLIYEITKVMPKAELYGLTSQLQRAAVSIPANLAEGNARGSRKDYARFIGIARGSAAELETLLTLATRVNLISEAAFRPAFKQTEEVGRMLTALKAKLSQDEGGFSEQDQSPIPNP